MKQILWPLLVALSLGSGSAMAFNSYSIAPGATLAPANNEAAIYFGAVTKSGGSFNDAYTIDFNNYTHPDEWSFQLNAIGLDLNGTHLTGLSGLTMSLYSASNSLLWSMPATAVTTTTSTLAGLLTTTNMNAYSDALYTPPALYHLAVTGSGNGFYDITLTVPEPETWAIFLAGIALLGLRLRNHQNMHG